MHAQQIKISNDVRKYCAEIGVDPLLVQGAGGNVSWKDRDLLWIKASGKWLSDAMKEEIFIPVDLNHLSNEIKNKKFFSTPQKKINSELRPSIETMLHVLMPHKIVVHLHPVEILAHLVRKNSFGNLKKLIGNSIKWSYIDYFQPGPELAKALFNHLTSTPKVDVVLLKNHGVVIGGENIQSIHSTLQHLLLILKNKVFNSNEEKIKTIFKVEIPGFSLSSDERINQLAIDNKLLKRLRYDWSLYPDHPVFLGKNAAIFSEDKLKIEELNNLKTPFIFIPNCGVLESNLLTNAQRQQLLCYYNVLIRQSTDEELDPLCERDIHNLLNWDAEKYRQKISKFSK